MSSKLITIDEIKEIATANNVGWKELYSVLQVESANSGFRSDGKLVILLEAHLVMRRLPLHGVNPLPLHLAHPGCCQFTQRQGAKFYNIDSWERVQTALDWASHNVPNKFESVKKAVYESCSWGRPQILGLNYSMIGFENVYKMVESFNTGEKAQINAMMKFLHKNNLISSLQKRDWVSFARGYNGKSAVQEYSTKLKDAFRSIG